ncbi:MAG TPA: hypothetical protein VFK57_15280 [Vicinamibacterales bacterium]|nr:hypothetical protein [Vicinamibacterales bacterium]
MATNRRTSVPFDPFHFEREASAGRRYSTEQAFREIYRTNHWGARERSGAGASVEQAAAILSQLGSLIDRLGIRTLLDVPCGDFAWMRHLETDVNYIGGDVLPELAGANQEQWGGPRRRFMTIDLLKDDLPDADLLLCRDCLVHLSLDDARLALSNIRRSRCEWLLTTTFPGCTANEDIVTGDWRPLNLQLPPFNLPPPERLLNEQCTEGGDLFADKSLGLWRVGDQAPER